MSKVIEEWLEKTTVKNRELINKFKQEFLINQNKKESSFNQYINVIKQLSTYVSIDRDLQHLKITDIENFLYQQNNSNTQNRMVYSIKNFYGTLQSEMSLEFVPSDLKDFLNNQKFVDSDKKNPPKPLTIEEVVRMRLGAKKNNDYKRLLTFELVYQFNFNLNELSKCSLKTWSRHTGTFNFKPELALSNEIIEYIEEKNALSETGVSRSSHQTYIKELGELYLDRNTKYSDITATRLKLFFTCPMCGNIYESNPKNWVIIEYSEEMSRWMVCHTCVEGRSL